MAEAGERHPEGTRPLQQTRLGREVALLTGLLRPDSGTLLLCGQDISRDSRLATELVAVLAQIPLPLGDLSVGEVLTITGHLRGLSRRDARRGADGLIERLGIEGLREKRLGKLSGGQWRLASIATTLAGDRPILVLDEPTNELDPVNRRMVWDLLLEFNRQEGRTIILVTHNVLEAERVIERVGIINHGRIMALGTPGELKARVDRRVHLELVLAPGQEARGGAIETLGEGMVTFHLALAPSPLIVVVLLLSPTALAGLGTTIGVLAPNQQVSGVIANLLVVVVMFLSPIFAPASKLPGVLQITARFLPPTYAADALRQTLAGRVTPGVGADLLILLLFAAGTMYLVTTRLDWRSR